jgi:hypothetical protein
MGEVTMKTKTGQKVILSQQQKTAAETIFGPELAQQIIDQAQATELLKAIEGLKTEISNLKASVSDLPEKFKQLDARVLALEIDKGVDIDIQGRVFKTNGQPNKGIAARIFRGAQ